MEKAPGWESHYVPGRTDPQFPTSPNEPSSYPSKASPSFQVCMLNVLLSCSPSQSWVLQFIRLFGFYFPVFYSRSMVLSDVWNGPWPCSHRAAPILFISGLKSWMKSELP